MFISQGIVENYITPEDQGIAAIIGEIIGSVQSSFPNPAYRQLSYAFTEPAIVEAIEAAHARGIDVKALLDYSQATGTFEAQVLAKLFAIVPRTNFTIGTSDCKNQIIHTKSGWINYRENAVELPEASFSGWREAAKEGYPVYFWGSYNLTQSAQEQVNSFSIGTDINIIRSLQKTYERLVVWNQQHHPTWQLASLDSMQMLDSMQTGEDVSV